MNPLIKIFVKLKSSYVIFESQKGMKFPQENVVLQNIAMLHMFQIHLARGQHIL